ncbi:hypothetical protein V7S43_015550 [Phytophthora oleae]|uniref:RRM domain-containing protein n=1 Tax=Phytophthora oleae TaxID=2107226 RepID=A0ABD3EYD8_9STRA
MTDAPVERFNLRVRNLPAVLSTEAITSLFSHYGATGVRVLQRRNAVSSGKEPGAAASKQVQKVVAAFATREAQLNAQKRLHALELAGHCLQVEVVGDGAATTSNEAKPESGEVRKSFTVSGQPPLPKGLPPPLPPTNPTQNPLYMPVPMAPHLGLNYAPSPLLEYKYPKATESIVRNIANALIALPRFYTQVLHLMNKMNLPTPFEENAIPGRFSVKLNTLQDDGDTRRERLKRRRVDENVNEQIVEEEEEEEEEDDENVAGRDIQMDEVYPLKAHELSETVDVIPNFDLNSSVKKDEALPDLIGKALPRQNKLLAVKKISSLNMTFQLGSDGLSHHDEHRSTRPGVITEDEVNRQRLGPEELLKEPLMNSYTRGFPSRTTMVMNIAHGVDEKDLRSVFGYVLPMDMGLDLMKISLLRAKNSALITFPNEELAIAAVTKLHGVQLEGKTMIVSFHSYSSEVPPAVERWSLQELANKRLPEAELASEKVMKKYQRGQPSNSLYVKNLAKTVELADLYAVFGAVLPSDSRLEVLNIRHFTSGRMKYQAFVTYPAVDLALSALLHVHGVVLKDKPLIVCFRKPQADRT